MANNRTSPPSLTALLQDRIATGAGAVASSIAATKTYQLRGTTDSGTGSATVQVQGSNDDAQQNWDLIGTISLTLGTTSTSDSFSSDDRYAYVRGNVTAISGTGARVTLVMGA